MNLSSQKGPLSKKRPQPDRAALRVEGASRRRNMMAGKGALRVARLAMRSGESFLEGPSFAESDDAKRRDALDSYLQTWRQVSYVCPS
mmetsp:Transcript_19742/g.68012  ORF Transcript_19742/g.68012 Transcript_19742/m.68012 type:complete len:88 (-) Transcript_19742:1360-1623(-)